MGGGGPLIPGCIGGPGEGKEGGREGGREGGNEVTYVDI